MPARRHRRLVPLAALTVVLSGCGGTALPPHDAAPRVQAATNTPAQPSARLGEAEVVIAISIDGLNPTALRRLGRAGAPAIHRMRRQGASTLNARTERELTRTLPNHTGMLTGRPVGGPDGHRVTFNEDNGAILAATAGHYVAGVFDVVHDHGGRTAFYASKDKFDFLARSWDRAHGAADTTGADNGRDKLDRYVVDRERVNVSRLVARLGGTPDTFSFVHLAGPDTAGHAQGFMSPAYLKAVRVADRQVGRILRAVRGDAALRGRTAVVLTSDHGGRGSDHSDPTKASHYRVPFVAWGVGVASGADLYALNGESRARPGKRRTTYAGVQPIRNAEVAGVVTTLLGLPDVPGSVIPRRRLLIS
ncbi:MAG: alkaline phosphatase family protein [Nocardioides sp.]